MKNNPKSITMEFGEELCGKCEGDKTVDGRTCRICDGTGTIKKTVTFELWKECPESHYGEVSCMDKGELGYYNSVKGFWELTGDAIEGPVCPQCEGSGEVPRYWTPEEAAEHIKQETGIEWEPSAVWVRWPESTSWVCLPYNGSWEIDEASILIAWNGQPAPDRDWRME